MSLRPLNLPADFKVLTQLTIDTFQYPENESWSVQSDDQENITDMFKSAQKMWPLMRLAQLISPALRDIIRGYIWEHENQPVGMIIMQRQNPTNTWRIGNVAVLPAYRRRGIARKLVETSLSFIREHGGEMATLGVISGNLPAYTLYQNLGFVHYDSRHEFNFDHETVLREISLPDGYYISRLKSMAWRPRFELAKNITPADVQQFEPVTEAHYNPGRGLMALSMLLMKLSGLKIDRITIRTQKDNKIVAHGLYRVRKRAGGVNNINLRVDDEHGFVARHLLYLLLNSALQLSPGRRIELDIPGWQTNVLSAVSETGCTKRYQYHSMGIVL
jgi:ribosomal protein S18 acetylase RimI-like enzyme